MMRPSAHKLGGREQDVKSGDMRLIRRWTGVLFKQYTKEG